MNLNTFKNIRFWIVVLAIILPLTVLYFDFRIYFDYVSDRKLSEEDLERVFLLNTPLIKKISQELKDKKEFLLSPEYPPFKDGF